MNSVYPVDENRNVDFPDIIRSKQLRWQFCENNFDHESLIPPEDCQFRGISRLARVEYLPNLFGSNDLITVDFYD
jgi:hypothetical protein